MLQLKKKRIKMRKTMSGLIMLTLFSSLVLPGSAGATPPQSSQVELANVSVQAGQTVHVPVVMKATELPIRAYNMQVDYDTTALEIVRITPRTINTITSSPELNTPSDFQ